MEESHYEPQRPRFLFPTCAAPNIINENHLRCLQTAQYIYPNIITKIFHETKGHQLIALPSDKLMASRDSFPPRYSMKE